MIAGIYGWFFRLQRGGYFDVISAHLDELALPEGAAVLDVGCGPGAFAGALQSLGFAVTGVDGAPNMVAQASKRGIPCILSDATKALPFGDGEFELVTAAFVAHGLFADDRISMYREMARVGTGMVVLHDFSQNPDAFSGWSVLGVLEWLEGSHYESFVSDGADELRRVFSTVRELRHDDRTSWYLCTA